MEKETSTMHLTNLIEEIFFNESKSFVRNQQDYIQKENSFFYRLWFVYHMGPIQILQFFLFPHP